MGKLVIGVGKLVFSCLKMTFVDDVQINFRPDHVRFYRKEPSTLLQMSTPMLIRRTGQTTLPPGTDKIGMMDSNMGVCEPEYKFAGFKEVVS